MMTGLQTGRIQVAGRAIGVAREDMEAGMAKLYCSDMAAKVSVDALRVQGGGLT